MTLSTEHEKIARRVGRLSVDEEPQRDSVVDLQGVRSGTTLASVVGPFQGTSPCPSPTYFPIGWSGARVFASLPQRRAISGLELRDPFPKACCGAKVMLTCELRSGPLEHFSAPVAWFNSPALAGRIGTPNFRGVIAGGRTVALAPLAGSTLKCRSTADANCRWDAASPSAEDIAGVSTVALRWSTTSIGRVVFSPALLANTQGLELFWHVSIVDLFDLDERNLTLARERIARVAAIWANPPAVP